MTVPQSWSQLSLGSFTTLVTSGSRGWAKYYTDSGSNFIRVQNIKRESVELDLVDAQFVSVPRDSEGERTKLRPGDILITITADLGRIGFVDSEIDAYVNQHVALVRICDARCAPFIARYLRSEEAQKQLGLRDRGITRSGLGLEDIREVSVPVPPLAEQVRIVAKLDTLQARTAHIRAELERTAKLTRRLRRSTLTSAFSGALTRDVRSPDDEGVAVMRPNLDDQERGTWMNDALPQGWAWVSFDEFFEDWTDSKRKIPETNYLENGRFPIVDQGRRFFGGYCDDQSMVQPVPLPAIVFGDHTRCVKFVDQQFVQGADGTKVLRAASGIEPRFAYYSLMAILIPAKGYSRHMKFVRKSVWPRPSLDEQRKIIARVEAAFARADRVDAKAACVTALLDRLEASILAKAFRGELVPQDTADEPASVLLNRISAERAAAPKTRRSRGSAKLPKA